MGFESDIREAIGSTGNQTQILIGEKDRFKGRRLFDASTPIVVAEDGTVSGGDFPKFQPILSGVDLAFLSNLIDSGVFTGSRARAASYPGQFRGSGGFVAGSSPLVTPFLVRALMQDKNPSYHILGGEGTALPNPVSVVDGQPLAGTTEKTLADDLATTANVVQLKITPKEGTETEIVVVNAHNLSSEDAIDIADDLSNYGVPLALTVAPTNTTTLADAAVPGEVIIRGLNADGNVETLNLSFPDGSKTDPQSPTQRFTEIIEVTATGFSAGTLTITVTLAAEITLGEGHASGRLRVEGIGNNNEELAENLYYYAEDFDDEGNLPPLMTDDYFKEITSVTSSGFAGGAFDITAQDKAVRVTIVAQDKEPAVYLHGELTRGDTSAVIDDMVISQLVLNLSPEEIVRYAIQTIYRLELDQQNLAGETGPTVEKTDASALEYPSEDFFVGFQGVLIIDGVTVPAKTVTLTVNQQWQHVGGLSGEQTDEAQPIAITRLTGLTGDFLYAKTNNLNRDYIRNKKFKNLELRLRNKLDGAFPAQIRVLMAKGELAANPIPTYSDTGEITQGFEINCLPTRIGASDDIKWIIDVPEYHRGRIYT